MTYRIAVCGQKYTEPPLRNPIISDGSIPLTPAQVTAQELAERWEDREQEYERRARDSADVYISGRWHCRVDIMRQYRRELQAAFGLDSLGAQAGEPERKP